MTAPSHDRSQETLGNIVHLEHVNVSHDDQVAATLFYIVGLGLTRDPYLMVGLDNMWANVGRSQIHLPTRGKQVLRGRIGLVLPDLAAAKQRLEKVVKPLAGTAFQFSGHADFIDATCPWGNHYRLHAPAPEFGPTTLGLPYVEFNAPCGSAPGIARFYQKILRTPATLTTQDGAPAAIVTAGKLQRLVYRETDAPQPPYDGHHVQIYIADFAGPHDALAERGLITEESDQHQYRFVKIVDPDNGKALFEIEHEVRSLTHPLYARELVNRNPQQSNTRYARNGDRYAGIY